jgi:hypothetical protein
LYFSFEFNYVSLNKLLWSVINKCCPMNCSSSTKRGSKSFNVPNGKLFYFSLMFEF